jgi:transcriptional regulator with XRE-family HTH domain
MSIGPCNATSAGPHNVPVPSCEVEPLQRLAEVRERQGVSCRTMARRLNLPVEEIRQQERTTTDLSLSSLYAWQKALGVPVTELLVESGDNLASAVLERSQLVRLMKSVLAICQQAKQESIRRMAETMAGQLIEIMPELEKIGPWHSVGKRRRVDELGAIVHRRLAENVFVESRDE